MNPERILRQHLEDLQRAGVTQVPVVMAELVAALSQASATRAPATEVPRRETGSTARPAPPRQPAPAVVASVAASVVPPVDSTSSAGPPKEHLPKVSSTVTKRKASPLSRDQRESKLASLAERVAACQKCQELAEARTQTVFGVGNPEARILFIGEAPGADEDKQGEPFVGRAGKLLNDIIKAMTLTREEIYICNILRCRPPGNRNPSPTEAGNCREFLDGQIETVNPEYIVCWGSVAAKNLLGTDEAIGKLRGKFYDHNGAKVLCTYHPSYLLRNPPAKTEVWKDMKFLMKDMGVVLK
ncbi:MAG: uracil-DNA glycosylase [Planctomycetota bacterium]|nr:uracil-DNA glycosylase [Planctomycetota bacterium]MDA1249805.1 uracil-DNA glycosylase [Planctomycetota bacterium]